MKDNTAQIEFETAINNLKKFCEENTDFDAIFKSEGYPVCIQFVPSAQMSFFENENVDENGEIGTMTVIVGTSTQVNSNLKFQMDAKLLKKMIKMAEKVGAAYYCAFRERNQK